MRKSLMVAAVVVAAAMAAGVPTGAQHGNPRLGKWKMKTENPPPFVNIMTYEAFGDKGMKVTVEATDAKGQNTAWWYTTEFDGKDMPVTGQENAMTSVERVNDRIYKIVNKRNGQVDAGALQHPLGRRQHDCQQLHARGRQRQDDRRELRDLRAHPVGAGSRG